MDTLGKIVFGTCMVGLAIVALAIVAKFMWQLGPVGIVLLALVAVLWLALRTPRS